MFRDRIALIIDQMFNEINHDLDAKGLIFRNGTLVDATLIQAADDPLPVMTASLPILMRLGAALTPIQN